jgi:hypothetical protein
MENKTFRKVSPFPSSGKGKETSTLLGRLERANFLKKGLELTEVTPVAVNYDS